MELNYNRDCVLQVIIWIGTENVRTNRILNDIEGYLNGLENIVMGNNTDRSQSGGMTFCEQPIYGHFVIVINKMMGSSLDEELQLELMAPEPGNT